jgi:hypothetical protein
MLYFLKASLKNFLKATTVCFIIFFILLLGAAVAVAISENAWDEFFDLKGVGILFIGPFGISLMVMLIAFVSEYHEFRTQQKLFSKAPFSSLATIGFYRTKLFGKTFWKLHKEVYSGMINGYLVIADMSHKKAVTFTFLTTTQPGISIERLEQYREIEIYPGPAGLEVKVPIDSYSTPGIEALQKLLIRVSLTLKAHNFQPQVDFKGYESKLKVEMFRKGLTG